MSIIKYLYLKAGGYWTLAIDVNTNYQTIKFHCRKTRQHFITNFVSIK